MSKQSRNLENLSQELSETVKRIDKLQERPPLRRRVVNHFSRQGSHIVGVVLAGTLFSVALDRLAQKRYYEVSESMFLVGSFGLLPLFTDAASRIHEMSSVLIHISIYHFSTVGMLRSVMS